MKTNKQQKMAVWAKPLISFQKQNETEPNDIYQFHENKETIEIITDNETNEERGIFLKNITINEKQKREIKQKEKQKRVITKEKRWILKLDDYDKEKQKHFLQSIYKKYMEIDDTIADDTIADDTNLEIKQNDFYKETIEKRERIIIQELYKKIYGYKRQDLEKNILCLERFINFKFVLQKIIHSNFICFYCNDTVQILYENVREPMQWTLDRIDNSFGHNIDNVEIACLNCNLRRRTIHYQRYLLTKQLSKIRKIDL